MALTTEEKTWAQGYMDSAKTAAAAYSAVDSERVADAEDAWEIRVFESKSGFCCFSHEEVVQHPTTGKNIKIGFNFHPYL